VTASDHLSTELFGTHLHGMVDWVRLDELERFREYDRSQRLSTAAPGGHSYTPEDFAAQAADVARNGIRNPLILQYNPRNHRALLGEGNHRLVWAQQAGHHVVPVRGTRQRGIDENEGARLPEVRYDPSKHFPGDFAPSYVLPPHMLGRPRIGREIPAHRLERST